jgi:hypothetical protein
MTRRRATILLKTEGHIEEGVIVSDYGYLGEPLIYPGMGVQRTTDGIDIGVGAVDGGRGVVAVAVEDHLLGKTIEDPYVEGGTCRFVIPQNGDELLVLVSSGQTLALGDMLMNDVSEGTWIKTTSTEPNQPFQVLEATDGALTEDSLVRVKRV